MPYKPNPATQCQYRSQLNRRCRLPFSPDHPTLCAFHARAARRAESTEHAQAVAAEMLAGTENFSTAASVNRFLGSLLKNFANHQITRRDATTMAYISQLLLNSQCVMHRQAQDAKSAEAAAEKSKPTRIVIDMPRPDYSHRGGESLDPAAASSQPECREEPPVPGHAASFPQPSGVLYNPDDTDPSSNPLPLPRRSPQRVYGFCDRARRHRYYSGLNFSRQGQPQRRAFPALATHHSSLATSSIRKIRYSFDRLCYESANRGPLTLDKNSPAPFAVITP